MDEPITWEELPQFMADVRNMAHGLLVREGTDKSLQTTALVVTALRRQRLAMQDWQAVSWPNRRYLFGALYRAMERALIDHGRRRAAEQRAAGIRVHLEAMQWANLSQEVEERPVLVVALTEALARLGVRHPQWAEVVQHRYYGGLTIAETARMLELNEKTVRRWWERARVLLHDEILQIIREEA